MRSKRWFIWALVLIILVLGGLASYIQISGINQDGQNIFTSVKPAVNSEGMRMFFDKTYGFGFQYPDAFIIQGNDSVIYLVEKKYIGAGGEGGELLLSVGSRSLQSTKQGFIGGEHIKSSEISESFINVGSKKIDKLSYGLDIPLSVYFFAYKNLTFEFQSYPQVENVTESIIKTLK